jgi:hypothetical protein
MTNSLEQHLKNAYLSAEEGLELASIKNDSALAAEHSRLATVLYDLASYFSEDGINEFQRQRLIQMGFNP